MLYPDVISLFAIREFQNIQKIDENSSNWRRKLNRRPASLFQHF